MTISPERSRFSGHCLCGAIRYEITGEPLIVAQCHCEECRRLSGTGHTVGAMFHAEDLVLKGELVEFSYQSAKNSRVTKSFCPRCGSPVLGRNSRTPDYVTLPLGTMDDTADLTVEVVLFKKDEQHWEDLADDIPRFDGQPDWKPCSNNARSNNE